MYPDLLHISDLQIIPDCILSTLYELTQTQRFKERFLEDLRSKYQLWCKETGLLSSIKLFFLSPTVIFSAPLKSFNCLIYQRALQGVPFGSRANPKMFTMSVISPSGTSYAHLSQKYCKGAASRLFIFWLCALVVQKAEEDRSQHNLSFGFHSSGPEVSLIEHVRV